MAEKQPQTEPYLVESKFVLALFLAWQFPEMGRHRATIGRATNPLIHQAYEAIQGGPKALIRVAEKGDTALMQLLSEARNYPPPTKFLSMMKSRVNEGFSTEPQQPEDPYGDFDPLPPHACNTWFDSYGTRSGPMAIHVSRTENHWRKYGPVPTPPPGQEQLPGVHDDTKPAYLYCPGCHGRRVRRIVSQVYAEALTYPRGQLPLTITKMGAIVAKKKINSLRANQKGFVYKRLPQRDFTVILIHNLPKELPGEPIPATRRELYDLIFEGDWAQTPEGTGVYGSRNFGGDFAGSKGDGRNNDDEDNSETLIRIRGAGYNRQLRALINEDRVAQKFKEKGRAIFAKGTTWRDYLEWLDAKAIRWQCVGGQELLDEVLAKSGYNSELGTRVSKNYSAPLVRNSAFGADSGAETEAPRPLIMEVFDG